MGILAELKDLAQRLTAELRVPPIRELFLPPSLRAGRPADHEFLVLLLEDGAAGVSYVLLPDGAAADPRFRAGDRAGTRPETLLEGLGEGDGVSDLLGLAAVNAVCQHAMREGKVPVDRTTDSLALLDLRDGDRVGMVGLFPPLLRIAREARIELVVVEKDPAVVARHPELDITLDPAALRSCNKVLATSVTVLNETLDEVLSHCTSAAHVAVVGPTAGFLPDPLFARGVHVVGGRYVVDGERLLARIRSGEPWGDATAKLCFRRDDYESPVGQILTPKDRSQPTGK